MSDPIIAHEKPSREARKARWMLLLVLLLRPIAFVSLFKGMYHWSLVLGIGDGDRSSFESATMPWQAATVFFAVIALVAPVGLWLPGARGRGGGGGAGARVCGGG